MKVIPTIRTLLCGFILFFTVSPSLFAQPSAPDSVTQAITAGRKLFHGQKRLTNKGPSCIACHNVSDPQEAISGGTYGLDLTTMYATFGEEAIHAFIGSSPFPVMKAAFAEHPVTEEEIRQLTAYLQYTSEEAATNATTVAAGLQFLWIGIGGLILILVVIWLAWRKRKIGSVNQSIYQRQIQTI